MKLLTEYLEHALTFERLAAGEEDQATRQSDFGAARAIHGAGTAAYAAAVNVAEIAHYRRLAAAALANNIRTTGPADALRDLGATCTPSQPDASARRAANSSRWSRSTRKTAPRCRRCPAIGTALSCARSTRCGQATAPR